MSAIYLCMAVLLAGIPIGPRVCELADEVLDAADIMSVAPALIVAIGHHESRWTPTVVNPKSGACGLFQQIPRWSPYSCRELMDPPTAFDGLILTWKWLERWPRIGGSIPEMLCGYSAGPKHCRVWPRGTSYSRTVERIAGGIILAERLLTGGRGLEACESFPGGL